MSRDGKKTGGGSRKGRPNKAGDLRSMMAQALSEAGGVAYLKRHASKSPAAFMNLLGRLEPKDVNLESKGSITMQVITGVPDASGN